MQEVANLLHNFLLPVLWVAPLAVELRHAAQAACPNHFLRFYPIEVSASELELYARDNTAGASAIGIVTQGNDNYGQHYLLHLRDINSDAQASGRSLALPRSYIQGCNTGRVSLPDIIYQLFIVTIDELELQISEKYYGYYTWQMEDEGMCSTPLPSTPLESVATAEPTAEPVAEPTALDVLANVVIEPTAPLAEVPFEAEVGTEVVPPVA